MADLPLEATIALAEVAGAIKDGLLAYGSAPGLVVMHQMMAAELTEVIGEKNAKKGRGRALGQLARQRYGLAYVGRPEPNSALRES